MIIIQIIQALNICHYCITAYYFQMNRSENLGWCWILAFTHCSVCLIAYTEMSLAGHEAGMILLVVLLLSLLTLFLQTVSCEILSSALRAQFRNGQKSPCTGAVTTAVPLQCSFSIISFFLTGAWSGPGLCEALAWYKGLHSSMSSRDAQPRTSSTMYIQSCSKSTHL